MPYVLRRIESVLTVTGLLDLPTSAGGVGAKCDGGGAKWDCQFVESNLYPLLLQENANPVELMAAAFDTSSLGLCQ